MSTLGRHEPIARSGRVQRNSLSGSLRSAPEAVDTLRPLCHAPRPSMNTPDAGPELSIVIPVFNEIESLDPLLDELRSAIAATGRSAEILLVDDASTDGSGVWMLERARTEPLLRPLLL